MMIKKEYTIGDAAWIYGINSTSKITKGTVVKKFTIDFEGFDQESHYIIAVPTEIEPLLEVRTWQTMSQDEQGPVGGFREVHALASTNKLIAQHGYRFETQDENSDIDDPSDEQIQAAIAKSLNNQSHQPLILKEVKSKPRRRFSRRKSRE